MEEGIDTLVLGCTHYPLLRNAIARLLGDKCCSGRFSRELRERGAGTFDSRKSLRA